MGKKGGSSWLTAVKRAFRSPTKESPDKGRNCRRKESHHHNNDHIGDQDDEKKKEKRRWLFKRGTNDQQEQSVTGVHKSQNVKGGAAVSAPSRGSDIAENSHAIAVEVATTAAVEAAVATTRAALKVTRLDGRGTSNNDNAQKQHFAAVVIQTSFRGYLARRALRALKGLVKLQALVRGHNVRKQAKMTLNCMQALVRVQARILDQRMRLSHEGSRKSTFSDTTSILESRYLQDLAERRSISHSREPSSLADDWDERPHTIEEVKAMLLSRKEAAFKREKSLSQAFSNQMWRSDRSLLGGEEEAEEKPRWLDRWMASKQWYSTVAGAGAPSPAIRARASTDHRESINTVEMDTSQPYSYVAPNYRTSSTSSSINYNPHCHNQRPASPLHSRAHHQQQLHTGPTTPSPARARPIQVRSASPRCTREDRSYSSNGSQTPSLRSNYYYNGHLRSGGGASSISSNGSIPNYMAATASAKARIRSHSASRQRPSTSERDRVGVVGGQGPKKRLSFPNNPDPYGGIKSVSGFQMGMMEQQSNYSSCCTDSLGGEISPLSTTDLRRWLR